MAGKWVKATEKRNGKRVIVRNLGAGKWQAVSQDGQRPDVNIATTAQVKARYIAERDEQGKALLASKMAVSKAERFISRHYGG